MLDWFLAATAFYTAIILVVQKLAEGCWFIYKTLKKKKDKKKEGDNNKANEGGAGGDNK